MNIFIRAKSDKNHYKIGYRIKLLRGKYTDAASNPIYGGAFGVIIGTVSKINPSYLEVNWDNGYRNSYRYDDPIELILDEKMCKFNNYIRHKI